MMNTEISIETSNKYSNLTNSNENDEEMTID